MGLTERQVEVLRLMAEGCSKRDVADRLVMSGQTAEHHVQHHLREEHALDVGGRGDVRDEHSTPESR